MQDLDYAEMLEIPVSTVTVTKKKSLFKRREQPSREDIKERVVDSVNERMGAFVEAEDLSDPPKKPKAARAKSRDRESVILFSETAAVFLIAMAIFLTNLFMPSSAINTFISSVINPREEVNEPAYSQLTLSPVVSSRSEADVEISDEGVMSFTAECSVYPVCAGKIERITGEDGSYIVKIAHTSTFSSVITGLSDVYVAEGDEVRANLPFAYSDGSGEVNVSLYDGDSLLNCYTLSGEVPVWKS